MADLTASTALRDFIANRLTTTGGVFMFATLHSAITNIAADSVYSSSGLLELTSANGYTAGGKTCGTVTQTAGVVDCPDVVWTTGGGETLTAGASCIWINDVDDINGAALVSMNDSAQTAGNGGTMTAGLVNPITIPTAD